jgi:quinol monooxygenase YgiN
MILVSVTRLRLRSLRFLPGFACHAVRSMMQAKKAAGCLQAAATRQRGLVFWTITLWNDEQAMRRFRNSGAHLAVMPKLARWCDEATYVHWTQDGRTAPTLLEAHTRLVADGILSKVLHPSPNHATRAFPPPGAKV